MSLRNHEVARNDNETIMKVVIDWLKELVDLKVSIPELVKLLPLRTIGVKEVADKYLELDMKGYNRADLLSMRGVAYEMAAITNSKISFNEESPEQFIQDSGNLPETKTTVINSDLCPLYCIAKISGLSVSPSKEELVKKLSEAGMRSVNNIADITNLIMLEYGQPIHAFDAKEIKDETLIVRVAKEGEKLTTLDGKERKLLPSDLLITDPEKAVGLAGVMGGKNSEVTESTDTILLEAAIFDPITLRKTAKRLGVPSEASKRFQHGLTKKRLMQALNAAIKLYQDLGGKLEAISIVGNTGDLVKKIELRAAKVHSLIGVEIPPEEVESSLEKLGFTLKRLAQDWEVTIPYWRLDIDIEEDLIEEVARMYGYEKIPSKQLEEEVPQKIDQSFPKFIYDLKKTLSETGLTEVQTYSFYSAQVVSSFKMQDACLIKIANPISSETEYLRDNLWPNLLEVTAKNIRNGIRNVAVFEIGKVYTPQKAELPKEEYRLSIALSNGTTDPVRELYQIFQVLPRLHLGQGVTLTQRDYFHPTRFSGLEKDGQNIGYIAEIHPRLVNRFGTEQRMAILEVKLDSSPAPDGAGPEWQAIRTQ